jgi:hypothetical protein
MSSSEDEKNLVRARIEQAGARLQGKGAFKTVDEIELWESQVKSRQVIKDAVDEAKEIILKRPDYHEQLLFSFMPIQLTRTTPFFPISKRDMKNRPHEKLEWETSWGKIIISGEKLSVYEETILLSLLLLVKKQRSEVLQTTQYELCKLANVTPSKNTYNAIWASLKRLSSTSIELSIWDKEKKPLTDMTGTIITWLKKDHKKGKLLISLNPYFNEMFAQSFVTNINLKFRANLTGDISKSMYRFFSGQKPEKYSIHILKLAAAINLNLDLPTKKIRESIRKGLRELRLKGYLAKWTLPTNGDIVTIWKSDAKKLLYN